MCGHQFQKTIKTPLTNQYLGSNTDWCELLLSRGEILKLTGPVTKKKRQNTPTNQSASSSNIGSDCVSLKLRKLSNVTKISQVTVTS